MKLAESFDLLKPSEDELRLTLQNILGTGSILHYLFPDEIYHYTSLQSLYSIMQNNTLWATESRFMNDAGESLYFKQFVDDLLPVLIGNQSQHENAVRKFHAEIMRNLYEINETDKENWLYILSFSKNKDSLAMWNYYGKNDGYCIGLNGADLIDMTPDVDDDEVDDKYKLYPLAADVIYDQEEQINILINDFDQVFELYLDKYSLYGDSSIPIIVHELVYIWKTYAPFFKHPSFIAEAEYRLVYEGSLLSFYPEYRIYQGIMAPYIEVEYPDQILPITSIMIGPMIKHDQALIGLRGWISQLKNEEFDLDNITKSTIPLRF